MIKNKNGIVVPENYAEFERMKQMRELLEKIERLEARVSQLENQHGN